MRMRIRKRIRPRPRAVASRRIRKEGQCRTRWSDPLSAIRPRTARRPSARACGAPAAPDGAPVAPRAIVQIVHGMCEHMGRYDEFARFLARNGFAVCGEDHIGHGESASDPAEFGPHAAARGQRTSSSPTCAPCAVLCGSASGRACRISCSGIPWEASSCAPTLPAPARGTLSGRGDLRHRESNPARSRLACATCSRASSGASRGSAIAARSSTGWARVPTASASPTRARRSTGCPPIRRSSTPIWPTSAAGSCSPSAATRR